MLQSTLIKRERTDRVVFLVALLTVILAGTGVLAIHNSTGRLARKRTDALTRGLWKFVPESELSERFTQRCWQWRLLLMAGLMVAATLVAMAAVAIGHLNALALGGGVFVLWIAGLVVFWHVWVIPRLNSTETNTNVPAKQGTSTSDGVDEGWKQKVKGDRDERLPVTIITGFLGSGKTTLVKRILNNTVGMRVLVIENEIGSEGIDHALLMQHTAKEEIVLMNNGCICCTVRQDLLKTFHRMFENEAFARLDWVVIETTGLADPAPLIQSLYIDDKCKERLRLDGVVTLVDSLHFLSHIERGKNKEGGSNDDTRGAHGSLSEARLQVAFADRVLLNKADLVSDGGESVIPSKEEPRVVTLSDVAECVRSINRHAVVYVCHQSDVPIDKLLNIRAFDASRNEEVLRTLREQSGYDLSGEERSILIQRDATGKILPRTVRLNFGSKREHAGRSSAAGAEGGVSTLSLTTDEPLDLNLFNEWIASVLRDHGDRLYRLKGILNMAGYDERFVAQGVHMIFDGERGSSWEQDKRTSTLVLIGLRLPFEKLKRGWMSCRWGLQA